MPTGSLPKSGKALWEKVYQKAKKDGDSEEKAAKKAWGAVKSAGWSKDKEGKWHKTAQLSEFSLTIKRAAFDKATGEMRWRADASDIDADTHNDSMTLELFNDFIGHIDGNKDAPEEFQTDFWKGGMPYLSVSHYDDLNGDGVPGPVEAVYMDGSFLKAKGQYSDTPLGRACFRSICDDLYNEESEVENKVRISIAFLDWMHKHKSNGFLFEREELSDICPECIIEMIRGESEGKEFLKGQLVHLAHTRVPVNERTLMEVDKSMTTRKEDATSIVGEELAEELEEQSKLVGKSEALVIKAEEEVIAEAPIEKAKKDKKEMEDEEDDEEETPKKKKKEEKKAEVVEEKEVEQLIERLKSEVFQEPEPHPLDTVLAELKASYNEALETNLSTEDKLRFVQDSYVAVGNLIKEDIQSRPQPEIEGSEIAKALQLLTQKVELLAVQMEEKAQTGVPRRRSIQPPPSMADGNPLIQAVSKQVSETPKLRAMLEETV